MSKAEKIFEKMKNTKHGWTPEDLQTLYTGFGFKYREGGNHRVYYHPDHPDLMVTVARHPSLVVGYIQTAIKMIERVKEHGEKIK
jgi:predicted RNA binding protein YcfA (HicA-like mRNA interferase family)